MEQSLKLKLLRKLLRKQGEEGFSLIELVVVVSVLAVLSAIAIPSFTCFQRKAQATAALAAMKQIQTECEINKTDTGNAGTFTLSNLNSYQIQSDGSNGCSGASGTGLISAIPNNTNNFPTFLLASNSNELTYSFKGETGTNFQDCLGAICLVGSVNSTGGGITTLNGVSIDQNGKPILLTDADGNPEINTWWYNWSATGGSPSIPCRATVGVVKKPDPSVGYSHPNNMDDNTNYPKSSFVMMERSHPDNLPESNMHAPDCPMVVVPDSFFSDGPPTKPFEIKNSIHLSGILNRGYGVMSAPRYIFDEEGRPLMFVPEDPELREQIKQRYSSIDWDTMTYGME